jgi:spermidine synthase
MFKNFPGLARSLIAAGATVDPGARRPRSIMVNGKADSSTHYDLETLKLSAHLPALLAERRARVMVVGLGTGVTAGEFTLYPDVESIDVAEIAPAVAEFLPLFEESTHRVHEDPRLRLHVGDAFRVIGRGQARWDIITSEPSNPWVTGVDQLFSRDFYRLVREHLREDGLFLQWLQRYGTNERIAGIILNTLTAEFPDVRVFRLPDNDDLLLASLRPIDANDLDRAEAVLAGNASLRESLAAVDVFGVDDLVDREFPEALEQALPYRGLGPETLDRPRIHYLSGRAFFSGESLGERERVSLAAP